ncbi:hypothetical protein MMC27_001879 [Xylographa pallens]|nr:hypothetical protein [Xylographa pallens]
MESKVTGSSPTTSTYLTGWKLAVVIFSLYLGTFVMALDTSIINVAVPKISADFNALEQVAWYGSAYLLTITAFQPAFGTLYKYFNISIVYRSCIVIFEVGSVVTATASSSPMFIAGRAVSGLGAAGLLQGSLSIIGHTVTLEKRSLYMGIVISVFVISVCIGPVIGGALTERVTWRWCFWINLPIGAVVLGLLFFSLRLKGTETEARILPLKQKLERMDPAGCVIFIGADSFFIPFWFQAVELVDPMTSGIRLIPLFLAQMIALIFTGAVVTRFGHYVPFIILGELVCVIGTVLLTKLNTSSSTIFWAAALVVTGLGLGMAMQLPYTALQVALSDADIAIGNAIFVFIWQLGGAISIAIGQTIIINTIVQELPHVAPEIDPASVIAAGATNLPQLTNSPEVLVILRGIWNLAITRTMIMSLAMVCAAIPCTMGMEWLNTLRVAASKKGDDYNGEATDVDSEAQKHTTEPMTAGKEKESIEPTGRTASA